MVLAFTTPDGPEGARVDLLTPDGRQTAVMTAVAVSSGGLNPLAYSFEDDFDTMSVASGTAVSTATPVYLSTGKGGWNIIAGSVNGSLVNASKSSTDHPGVVGLRTGVPGGSAISMLAKRGALQTSNVNQPFLDPSKIDQLVAICRWSVNTGIRQHIGFSDAPGSTVPANAISFRVNPAILGNSNFWAWIRVGSVDQLLFDTGVPLVAATFYKLAIKQATLGTITFEINGVQVASGSVLPIALLNFELLNQTDTAGSGGLQCDLDLDYVGFQSKALVR